MLYKGVITNNKDPDQLGRYQVRIFGLVDGNKSGFATSKDADLPWAEAIGSTAFGNIGGVGVSSIMHQGTWVWVMLMNDDPNIPVILGTVFGNAKKDQDGFGDPDSKFPQEECSDLKPISGDKYNFNQVIKTQSGHLIEIDDSEGDERIHIHHKTGTDILIDHEGNIKVLGVKDADIKIADNVTWDIGKNSTIKIGGNSTISVQGNLSTTVNGNCTSTVSGNSDTTVSGNCTNTTSGDFTNKANSITSQAQGAHTIKGSPVSLN